MNDVFSFRGQSGVGTLCCRLNGSGLWGSSPSSVNDALTMAKSLTSLGFSSPSLIGG